MTSRWLVPGKNESVGEHEVDELIRMTGSGEIHLGVPACDEVEPIRRSTSGLLVEHNSELPRDCGNKRQKPRSERLQRTRHNALLPEELKAG